MARYVQCSSISVNIFFYSTFPFTEAWTGWSPVWTTSSATTLDSRMRWSWGTSSRSVHYPGSYWELSWRKHGYRTNLNVCCSVSLPILLRMRCITHFVSFLVIATLTSFRCESGLIFQWLIKGPSRCLIVNLWEIQAHTPFLWVYRFGSYLIFLKCQVGFTLHRLWVLVLFIMVFMTSEILPDEMVVRRVEFFKLSECLEGNGSSRTEWL